MSPTSGIAFSIDRVSAVPVFEQICRAIRSRATCGELAEGSRLPPTRVFATELGVSRSTVVAAYEQLVAEGYLNGIRGSGYTIQPTGGVEISSPPAPAPSAATESTSPVAVPFQAGLPDMRLFPYNQWSKTVSRICRTKPESMLTGGSLFGNFNLRAAVAAHVSQWRGIEASPNQIIITAGSGDALELCLRALAEPGDQIGLEDPGYPPLRSMITSLGMHPDYLEIDQFGAIATSHQSGLRAIVLTPSHQYPLGGAMAPSRRNGFIDRARKHDSWIIEDDYDSEFRYAGRPIPAMAGSDKLNRVIYVGSFSKIFSNSLRLGYAIVPDSLVDRFRHSSRTMGVRASYMPQQALADFIDNGEFYRHLRRVRRIYGERRHYLLGRLADDFSGVSRFNDHEAGMQIALHLEDRFDDAVIAKLAAARQITVNALSQFCYKPSSVNGLLLGFCAFTEEEMTAALTVLKDIFHQVEQ